MLRRPPSRIELKSEDKEEVRHRVNFHSRLFRSLCISRAQYRRTDGYFSYRRRSV